MSAAASSPFHPNDTGPVDSREAFELYPTLFTARICVRAAQKHLLKNCGVLPRASLRKKLHAVSEKIR